MDRGVDLLKLWGQRGHIETPRELSGFRVSHLCKTRHCIQIIKCMVCTLDIWYKGWIFKLSPGTTTRVTKGVSQGEMRQVVLGYTYIRIFVVLSWVSRVHPINLRRVDSGNRKINDYQFFSPYYRLFIDFLILYRLILSTFLFSHIWPWNRPGTWLSTQLNFTLRS